MSRDLDTVFQRLRRILEPYGRDMHVSTDTATGYTVDRAPEGRRAPNTYFGGVRVGKRYVSYYLMPLYADPSLADTISPALRRRMQGKSCFNFSAVDDALFGELEKLTRAGYERAALPSSTNSSQVSASDLDELERRIWSLLEPYRGELEAATIYGMPSLRWPGAKAHDYFAAVKRATNHVSLFVVTVDQFPETLDSASPALLKRRTGKATFTFPSLDDALAGDVAAFLARLYARYRAAHA